jgi:phospholipid/cholesterol/gamma-HCH transport system permease protein
LAHGGAWARVAREGRLVSLTAGGRWTLAHVQTIQDALAVDDGHGAERVRIDLAGVETLDSAGAFLMWRWIKPLAAGGAAIEAVGMQPAQEALLKRVDLSQRASLAAPYLPPLRALIVRIGRATFDIGRAARDLIDFLGVCVVALLRAALDPRRLRPIAIMAHIERIGLHALPIVGLLSFLIGVVLAYQGADQLRSYGAEIFTVNLLGISVLRELGILLTSIMVAGRSGSAFTAEIGTMKVNEEVDAMRTLGLDPVDVLVLPRIVAMIIALPLLAFYASMMAIAGGALMCMAALDISLPQFLNQLNEAIGPNTFWVGMVKAPVFAFLIALVGTHEGLQVSGSAESVGRQTTKSVVESIFLVIVADAGFSIMFSALGV